MSDRKRKRTNSDEDSPPCKKQKTFVCEVCQKTYSSPRKLWNHKLIHVYHAKCSVCGKSFSHPNNMKKHQRQKHNLYSHDKNNSTECSLCNKIFTNKYHRKRHEVKQHGVGVKRGVSFSCRQCDREFNDKTLLFDHVSAAHANGAAHTNTSQSESSNERSRENTTTIGGNTFRCPHCDLAFADYDSLFGHVIDKHPLPQQGGRVPEPPVRELNVMDNTVPRATTSHETENQQARTQHETENQSALDNTVQNRLIFPSNNEQYDLLVFLANTREEIKDYILSRLTSDSGIRWNIAVNIQMERDSAENETVTSYPYFRCRTVTTLNSETFDEQAMDLALQQIHSNMEKYIREGSQWYIRKIIKMEISTIIYQPLTGSSYIPLPKALSLNKSILNLKNSDSKCFQWCLLASLFPTDDTPHLVHHYQAHENDLNFKNIRFPVSLTDIDKFEKQNAGISVNAFGWEDEKIIPLKITTHHDRPHHVDLLLIKNGELSHWCLIKNLNRFLSKTKNHNDLQYFCCYCLHGFTKESLLKNHIPFCSPNGPQRIELPSESDNILRFNDFSKTQKLPFVIFCDLETLNKKISTCSPKSDVSNTTPMTSMEVCGFGYKVVCIDDQYTKPTVVYRGNDASEKLLDCLLDEQQNIEEILSHKKTIQMTPQDVENAKSAEKCCICNVQFTTYDNIYEDRKVYHHCHLTGAFLGVAHNVCNINCKQTKQTRVVFHNLKGFDSHFITFAAAKFKNRKLTCIAQNSERYISFRLSNIVFIDSLAFLPSSLETLVENLAKEGEEAFSHLKSEFADKDKVALLLRKGVYMYDYMDNEDRFLETELPPKEAFYNVLKQEDISDSDYQHAQTVFSKFEMQNLGDYHDLYLKSDVILLADVFETFRNTTMKEFGLDPAQ